MLVGRIKYFPSGLAWDEDLLDGEEIASMEVSMKQLVGLQCEREKDSLWKYKGEYGLLKKRRRVQRWLISLITTPATTRDRSKIGRTV